MRISLEVAPGLVKLVSLPTLARPLPLVRAFCGIPAGNDERSRIRQEPPRLGRGRQASLVRHVTGAARDTTHGRCTMAGRPAPPAKSRRRATTRLPWRALGLGSSAVGGIAAGYSHPLVGLVIVSCVTAAAIITIATALFGSATTSDRAFRLLRWLVNRPEPKAPPIEIRRAARRSRGRRRVRGTGGPGGSR